MPPPSTQARCRIRSLLPHGMRRDRQAASAQGECLREPSTSSLLNPDRRLEWAVALVIVLMPVTLPFNLVGMESIDGRPLILTFFPVDLGLVTIVVLGVPKCVGRIRAGSLPLPCVLLQTIALLIFTAALVNPTPAGFQVAFRMSAVVIVVLAMADVGPRLLSGPILYACLAVALEQSLLAVGQVIAGHGLGLSALGLGDLESVPLIPFGGVPSARGTFLHPYVLAGFTAVMCTILLARTLLYHKRFWTFWALTAATAVPLGLTFSRMSVLALGLFSIVLVAARCGRCRRAGCLAALLLGVLTPAISAADGWIARGQQSVQASDAETLTSGRLILLRQAWQLIESSPLLGVGPDNYLSVVGGKNPDLERILHVHNVPLLVAAENGILAGLLLTALLVSLAIAALRSGAAARWIFCALLPFLLLDHFAYSRVQGLVLFGLWIGAVLGVGRIEKSASSSLVKDARSETPRPLVRPVASGR